MDYFGVFVDAIFRVTCGFGFLSLNPEGVRGAPCIMILSMMGKAIFLLLKSDLKGLKCADSLTNELMLVLRESWGVGSENPYTV